MSFGGLCDCTNKTVLVNLVMNLTPSLINELEDMIPLVFLQFHQRASEKGGK